MNQTSTTALPLHLSTQQIPQQIESISAFISATLLQARKGKLVVAVSGGIDSALSVSLACRAVGRERVQPLLLPFRDQDMADARAVLSHLGFAASEIISIDIQPAVSSLATTVAGSKPDQVRLGNIMARVRMIYIFDLAKQLDALVCGTENKSEKYLAYFTRFGDEASDLEPLQHLYKSQVRQLAEFLSVPRQIIDKAPTAGLWADQTDEAELGFSYEAADAVLWQLVDRQITDPAELARASGQPPELVARVVARVTSQQFKHEVPYRL